MAADETSRARYQDSLILEKARNIQDDFSGDEKRGESANSDEREGAV
jgi:hypothetical protein